MDKRIVAVVVTYNRKDCLLRCVEALGNQTAPTDVLIVDNASTDGTAEALAPLLSDTVRYVNTGENLGGAGGFQFGVRQAVSDGYDLLWLMDDDCIPETYALEALLTADKRLEGHYGFLSGMAYWRAGNLCNMNVQKVGIKEKLTDLSSPVVPVAMATFVSLLVPARRVKQVGLPIKEFFIWSDDLEYTRRLSRRFPCFAVPASRVLHDMHSNDNVNIATDSPDRLGRYAYLYRNEVYVYRREGIRGWLYLIPRVCYHLLKVLLKSDHKWAKMKVILSSFFAGFSFNPPIEYVD